MSDVVRPCCWICVPKCPPPEAPRFKEGFGKLCCIRLGVQRADRSNILGQDWGQVWPSWALLRYLEATALLLAAKLGYRELKLSWAMLCYVEAICQILFGHAVGFASKNEPPPRAGPRFSVGFCKLCSLHSGVKFGYLAAMLALLAPSWDQLRPSRGP